MIVLAKDEVAIRPIFRDGIGYCSEDDCPEFDGKRCRVMGNRPGETCEPWSIENEQAGGQLRKALVNRAVADCDWRHRLRVALEVGLSPADRRRELTELLAELGT